MFIEIHMLQSFAPSNLNRDDTNNPKDCTFGGVRRARLSSQTIKRAIRKNPIFKQTAQSDLGVRTKQLVTSLQSALIETVNVDRDTALDVASTTVIEFAGKLDNAQTSVLIYISPDEIMWMAERLAANWGAIQADRLQDKPSNEAIKAVVKDYVKEFKERTPAPDIAMFGRMLANTPVLNIDAACQVAHALSTHRVSMEMDFFTAVDDLLPEGEAGAGMMGMIGYNSATFYRYMRIDWRQLVQNLFSDTELAQRTVEAFLRSAVVAIPTGKQTSFAAQNVPEFLLGVVRQDGMSWSLANAFEMPVRSDGHNGLMRPSIKQLDTYWGRLVAMYGINALQVSTLTLHPEVELPNLGYSVKENMDIWVSSILASLTEPAL